MTADDIIKALRTRHPAYEPGFVGVGRWVTLTEWANVDLLALDAWQSGKVVGYEVKCSRSDFRSELLKPHKRAEAVAMTTQFYLAAPVDLLTFQELGYIEPEWAAEDFQRAPCTNPDCSAAHRRRGFMRNQPKPRGSRLRGTDREGSTVHLGSYSFSEIRSGSTYRESGAITACCTICKGYGTTGPSRVEQEAPTLWVPRDVGLIGVYPSGVTRVLVDAPRRKITTPLVRGLDPALTSRLSAEDRSRMQRHSLAQLIRWTSARPDPRHH